MSSSKEGSPKEPLHSFNSGISDAGRPRGCMFDPEGVALMERSANVTQLPRENFEVFGGGFIATGPDEETVQKIFEYVRYRVAFYGSTRLY